MTGGLFRKRKRGVGGDAAGGERQPGRSKKRAGKRDFPENIQIFTKIIAKFFKKVLDKRLYMHYDTRNRSRTGHSVKNGKELSP